MAATKISDIIVPSVFNPYFLERTKELTQLLFGGIVSNDAELDALALAGGKLINMPFWNDLTGDDEVLSDASPLTVGAITAGQDIAALHMRGKAWGANDLATALAASDPLTAVANDVGSYWARRRQALLIASLNGVVADNVANDSGDMVHDIAIETGDTSTAANWISASAVITARGTMGDASFDLTSIAMHSTPFQRLQEQEAIVYERPAGTDISIPRYLGMNVLVDDGLPVVAGATNGFKYTSFLFGEGAVGLGEGAAKVPAETDRDSLAGEDILVTRSHFVFHPRGVKFTSASVAGETPTNTELANAANWDRVYPRKNVRIAALVTNG